MSFLRSSVLVVLSLLVLSPQVLAESRVRGPIVVELYTSMGCSSCPPADRYLTDVLKKRNDVISLAFHVDYWDYLGWKDSMAQPQFTMRQRKYARARGKPVVYTPQIIVQGQDFLVGSNRDAVGASIARALESGSSSLPVLEVVKLGSGRITVIAKPGRQPLRETAYIYFFKYLDTDIAVGIKRGENASRVITYSNPVVLAEKLAEWKGSQTISVSQNVEFDESEKGVVVLQMGNGYGPIIFAARVEF